jgi:hypothetical protein
MYRTIKTVSISSFSERDSLDTTNRADLHSLRSILAAVDDAVNMGFAGAFVEHLIYRVRDALQARISVRQTIPAAARPLGVLIRIALKLLAVQRWHRQRVVAI